jgi:folate-binding protein YgfZ
VLTPAAWATLRVERNFPEFGTDFDAKDRPHEAALDRRAVSWNKGCYLGQEEVCMQDMRGKVKRSVRMLALDVPRGTPVPSGVTFVTGAGDAAGNITSAAYSDRAGTWLALAKLDLDAASAPLFIVTDGERHAARLSEPV